MRRAWLLAGLLAGCAESVEMPRTSTLRVIDGATCGPLVWPVDAAVSSAFGRRDGRPHQGIDLAVQEGTPVRAACEGLVVYAGDKLSGYGRMVVLEHADGLSTVYAHNSHLRVEVGSRVAAGQIIADSGESGRARGAHLHFEVRERGRPIDPLSRLATRSSMLSARARVPRPQ